MNYHRHAQSLSISREPQRSRAGKAEATRVADKPSWLLSKRFSGG